MAEIKVVYRKLGRHKAMGRALQADYTIEIDSRLEGVDLTDTIIHEVIHCLAPEWIEEHVDRIATQIATVLHSQLNIEKK